MKCAHCDQDVETGWKLCSKCSDRMVERMTGLFQNTRDPYAELDGAIAIPDPVVIPDWDELRLPDEAPPMITSGPDPSDKTRALALCDSERDILERNLLAEQVECWLYGD